VAETLALLAAAHARCCWPCWNAPAGPAGSVDGFIERTHLPVAATLTGKSVVAEHHPAYLGVIMFNNGGYSTERFILDGPSTILPNGVSIVWARFSVRWPGSKREPRRHLSRRW
jgi:thiamine pyrophosphate-dependent acetolactate synthase large subunit-like protein